MQPCGSLSIFFFPIRILKDRYTKGMWVVSAGSAWATYGTYVGIMDDSGAPFADGGRAKIDTVRQFPC